VRLGVTRGRLGEGQALPRAEVGFGQAVQFTDRDADRLGDRVSGLACAQQR
jgi:hypothetical protein